jgi:uncharacterized protein (DUF1499 family)
MEGVDRAVILGNTTKAQKHEGGNDVNIVRDLLPWEPLFSLGSAGLVVTMLTMLVSVLRRHRIGATRKALLAIFAITMVLPWLLVRNFGERLTASGTTNRADTTTNTPPDLQPREYAASPQQVSAALATAVDQLGWELVRSNDNSTFEIEVPVPRWGWFIDDMTVTLREANGTTVVNMQSQSRVGRGDLGENRRHIVQLFTVLDQMLEG